MWPITTPSPDVSSVFLTAIVQRKLLVTCQPHIWTTVWISQQRENYIAKCDSKYNVIPQPAASEHRWLLKAHLWIYNILDVSGKQSWFSGCHVWLRNLRQFTKWSRLSTSWQIWRHQRRQKSYCLVIVIAHLAIGCDLKWMTCPG